MAKRKRTSSRSSIVGRAVKAGQRALREAEKRVPPDLRRQVERRLKDADKTARAAIKQLQTQAKRASTRADVNSVLKRIDGLTKQAREIARGTGSRAASTRRRATGTAKRAATRTRKAAGSARRKASSRASSTRRTTAKRASTTRTSTRGSSGGASTRRAATPRRRRSTPTPAAESAPAMPETMAPDTGGAVEMGQIIES